MLYKYTCKFFGHIIWVFPGTSGFVSGYLWVCIWVPLGFILGTLGFILGVWVLFWVIYIYFVADITRPYSSMVLSWMMFGRVIAMIVYTFVPENPKL